MSKDLPPTEESNPTEEYLTDQLRKKNEKLKKKANKKNESEKG